MTKEVQLNKPNRSVGLATNRSERSSFEVVCSTPGERSMSHYGEYTNTLHVYVPLIFVTYGLNYLLGWQTITIAQGHGIVKLLRS